MTTDEIICDIIKDVKQLEQELNAKAEEIAKKYNVNLVLCKESLNFPLSICIDADVTKIKHHDTSK